MPRKASRLALRELDDAVRAIGLVLVSLGMLAALVLLSLFAPDGGATDVVVGGLVSALAAMSAFYFRREK